TASACLIPRRIEEGSILVCVHQAVKEVIFKRLPATHINNVTRIIRTSIGAKHQENIAKLSIDTIRKRRTCNLAFSAVRNVGRNLSDGRKELERKIHDTSVIVRISFEIGPCNLALKVVIQCQIALCINMFVIVEILRDFGDSTLPIRISVTINCNIGLKDTRNVILICVKLIVTSVIRRNIALERSCFVGFSCQNRIINDEIVLVRVIRVKSTRIINHAMPFKILATIMIASNGGTERS